MEGDPVGKGTYGTVWKGQCLETKEPVAMKKVDLRFEKEGLPTTCVREIRALRRLSDALEEEKKTKGPGLEKNVVRLLDIWTEKPAGSLVGDTYLVFEYVHHDLTGYVHYRGRKLLL
ncbi:lsk1, partial [Symbiodinium sp. KB8]